MSNHQVAHNAVRAGTRYYQSRRKGAERRLRRDWREGASRLQRAFAAWGTVLQRAAQALQRMAQGVRAAQTDPTLPLIDRVRLRMALHPGEGPVQVARAVGEERVLRVAVLMRMVTLAAERGTVRATQQPSAHGGYSPVDGVPESSGSLPASRPVQEGR